MICCACYPCALGFLEIGWKKDRICSLRITPAPCQANNHSPVTDAAALQVHEYLAGTRTRFDLPISPTGTDFQQAVWKQLCAIPYGSTQTYGQIASAIGKPRAARAVGMACSSNPLWLVIPCHRVIGANGSLTGYAGGQALKQQLLTLESSHN